MIATERQPRTHHCDRCVELPDPIDIEHDLCGQCLDEVYEDFAREADFEEEIEPADDRNEPAGDSDVCPDCRAGQFSNLFCPTCWDHNNPGRPYPYARQRMEP